ncbi:copper resistance CopC family protein [Sedimentitalea todarodis]|uniref:Copper resistance protein CopC n=1 Tax=Sedimentitalea todarodis TaxID=1631240 RepID=A0ABU3VJT1_9RHOB|nr:copper resistance protein CopC [Sedimentitalea todarodis]MDU9006431.1 copper resistance protein CopC [Sedimentitalea todarodis]
MKPATYLAAIVALSLAFAPPSANAHSKKEATEPANGIVLETSPPIISMRFDMPMRVTLISVTDQDGTAHDLTRTDNMQPVSEFSATPPVLPTGQYTVEWRGLAADGHPMQGAFSFEISN